MTPRRRLGRRRALFAAAALLAAGLAVPACSGDEAAPEETTPSGAGGAGGEALDAGVDQTADVTTTQLGSVSVEVAYEGAQAGAFYAGAFLQSPPVSPAAAYLRRDEPAFPVTGPINGLEPGTYYVVAVLDVGADDAMLPGEEDVVAISDAVAVKGGGSMPVTLTLVDPE